MWKLATDEPEVQETGDGRVYSWSIKRGSEQRTIRVEVPASRLAEDPELPMECRDAITSRGRSVVEAQLSADDPHIWFVVRSDTIALA